MVNELLDWVSEVLCVSRRWDLCTIRLPPSFSFRGHFLSADRVSRGLSWGAFLPIPNLNMGSGWGSFSSFGTLGHDNPWHTIEIVCQRFKDVLDMCFAGQRYVHRLPPNHFWMLPKVCSMTQRDFEINLFRSLSISDIGLPFGFFYMNPSLSFFSFKTARLAADGYPLSA